MMNGFEGNEPEVFGDYVMIKALEDGVTIIGLTRGKDTKFAHTEKLDRGEVMIAQFTTNTSAMKIRGHALILTKLGSVQSGRESSDNVVGHKTPSGSGD